jgi:hypothetical protein
VIWQIHFLLVGALAFGVGLLIWWRRGTRINDHPTCGRCGFDLVGLVSGGSTRTDADAKACPECGSSLARPRAVRTGVRCRRHGRLAVVIAACLLAIGPVSVLEYSAFSGDAFDRYKPLRLLLWETRRSDARAVTRVLDEIFRRMAAGDLDAEGTAQIVSAALAAQADLSRPWNESWYLVLDRARLDGNLSPQAAGQFELNSAVLEIKSRADVVAGSSLPVRVTLGQPRLGPSMRRIASVHPARAWIGDRECALRGIRKLAERAEVGLGRNRDGTATFEVRGSLTLGNLWRDEPGLWEVEVPADMPPGAYTLKLESAVSVADPMSAATSQDNRVVTLTSSVEIRAAETPHIELIPATDAISAELLEWLRPVSVTRIKAFGGGPDVEIVFPASDPPVPFAFSVSGRSPELTWNLGYVASGDGLATVVVGRGSRAGRRASWRADLPDLKTITLVLTPSPEVAAGTLDMLRIYGGPIVLEDVPVKTVYGTPDY